MPPFLALRVQVLSIHLPKSRFSVENALACAEAHDAKVFDKDSGYWDIEIKKPDPKYRICIEKTDDIIIRTQLITA